MGGGFKFAANSATTPPLSAARNFLYPVGSHRCYFSDNDSIFRPVPSRVEVESAILELQRFMRGLSTTNHHSQSAGFIKFAEAFAMMQAQPPLKKLVTSISCDKAVWEAILSNEAIHHIQGSISAAAKEKKVSYGDEAEFADHILRLILDFSKSKIIQLVEKFLSLVNDLFHNAPKKTPTSELNDLLDEKIRSSLLLSIVILLIVVVARSHN